MVQNARVSTPQNKYEIHITISNTKHIKYQIRISTQHKQTPDTQQHTTQQTPDTQQHATQQTPDTQQHTTQQTLDTHYNISAQYNNIRYEIRITTVVQNHIRYYTSRYIHGSLYHTVYIRIYIYTPVGTHSLWCMGNVISPVQQSNVSKLKGIARVLNTQQIKIRTARSRECISLKRTSMRLQNMTKKYNKLQNCDLQDIAQDDMRQVL